MVASFEPAEVSFARLRDNLGRDNAAQIKAGIIGELLDVGGGRHSAWDYFFSSGGLRTESGGSTFGVKTPSQR